MQKVRFFLINDQVGTSAVNTVLENLERKNIKYDVYYSCEDSEFGILITVNYEE